MNHEGEDQEDENHQHSDVNPHVWLDPIFAKEMAAVVRDAIIEKMPENKDYFNDNYAQLAQDLDELHAAFDETIKSAKHNKIIVTMRHLATGNNVTE